jgi:hypothetical protein
MAAAIQSTTSLLIFLDLDLGILLKALINTIK